MLQAIFYSGVTGCIFISIMNLAEVVLLNFCCHARFTVPLSWNQKATAVHPGE